MTDPFDVEVFTRDRSSGRIHRRYRMPDGSLASAEADNLDEAGVADVVDQAEVDAADSHDLCGRCFPQPANDVVDPGVPNDTVPG